MAYDRAGTGPWGWLKSVGSADSPLARDWRVADDHLLSHCWFTKRPRSLRAGDLFVYYAARWGVVIALMELVSDEPVDNGDHPRHPGRWRWQMDVRPLVTLAISDAPSLDDVGIDPLRVRRQSHILLGKAEWDLARDRILAAARRDVRDPRVDARP